jgi:alkylation response protein AidB-like acyl-CoA dehydrogenase
MRWELAAEQLEFQESFRGWLSQVASTDAVRGWIDSGDPSPFEKRLVEEGWFAVGTSESRGGQGGGAIELALVAEELARAGVPSSAWLASVLALGALDDTLAANVLDGGGFAALAVGAGSPPDDVAEGTSPCRLRSDGTVVGRVPLVLGADRATLLVVPVVGEQPAGEAVTSPGPLSLVLVDATADGVTVASRSLLDRTRTVADVHFDGARAVRLGVDAGQTLAAACRLALVLVAADSLGAMERMLDLAVSYSKTRQQFGAPIGSFQAVKHAAASILVSVEAARSIVYYAAASVEQGEPDCAIHAAIAKAQVGPSAVVAADTALTMHGAIGYTWEHDLHLHYKRAKLDDRLFGGAAIWNERIAQALQLSPMAYPRH